MVLVALHEAGWASDRQVEEDELASWHAELSPVAPGVARLGAADGVLRSFGGLVVEIGSERVIVEPVRAYECDEWTELGTLGGRAGEALYPVGLISQRCPEDGAMLLVGASGAVYASVGDVLSRLGDDLLGALDVVAAATVWAPAYRV